MANDDTIYVAKALCDLNHGYLGEQISELRKDMAEIKAAIVGNHKAGLGTRVALLEENVKYTESRDTKRGKYFIVLFAAVIGLVADSVRRIFINN